MIEILVCWTWSTKRWCCSHGLMERNLRWKGLKYHQRPLKLGRCLQVDDFHHSPLVNYLLLYYVRFQLRSYIDTRYRSDILHLFTITDCEFLKSIFIIILHVSSEGVFYWYVYFISFFCFYLSVYGDFCLLNFMVFVFT